MAVPLRYNVLSLLARPVGALSTIGLVGVIIAVFAYLQAVTDSAFATMAGTGDPNTVIVINQAADTETVSGIGKDLINKLSMAPGAVGDDDGPCVSAELVAISSAFKRGSGEVAVNTCVRGVNFEEANRVRQDRVRVIEGRPFQPGTFEVIVGQGAHMAYRGFEVGDTIQLGTRGVRNFKITGIFTTDGTAADSEIWAYVETLRDVYGRSGYSSARLLAPGEQAAKQIVAYVEGPGVEATAMTEQEYFSELNTNQTATQVLSIAMIIIMGTAAAFGIANTMYSAVAGRTAEIGMLRALGFGRSHILTSFVVEGLMLTLAGGVLGCMLSLFWHGLRRTILPTTFSTVSYTLEITPKILFSSIGVALLIGVAGSIMPAWRAAKMSVVGALREQ